MKRVVLLNSGGLDSALKAKELYVAVEPVEAVVKGGATEQRAYEIYSLFVHINNQVGVDKKSYAAAETAARYCDSHHVVTLDFGYSPNYYEDFETFVMYDDTETAPTRINKETLEEEFMPLFDGPPNLSSVYLSIAVSYAKRIGADEVHSGLRNGQLRDAASHYSEAMKANHSVWNNFPKADVAVTDEFYSKEEAETALRDYESEFEYVDLTMPIDEKQVVREG
jgi:7-cyano-7-deazaguanine synthase in queuosine biosynthesis